MNVQLLPDSEPWPGQQPQPEPAPGPESESESEPEPGPGPGPSPDPAHDPEPELSLPSVRFDRQLVVSGSPAPPKTLGEAYDAGLAQAVTRGLQQTAPLANNRPAVVLGFVDQKGRYTIQLWATSISAGSDDDEGSFLAAGPLPHYPPIDVLPENLIFERHTQAVITGITTKPWFVY